MKNDILSMGMPARVSAHAGCPWLRPLPASRDNSTPPSRSPFPMVAEAGIPEQSPVRDSIAVLRQERRFVSVETPFLWWDARCATILPAGQIVWQLGPQIVIYDPESRDLGVLALGQGPVVGLDAN